jgi:hypothetical protein
MLENLQKAIELLDEIEENSNVLVDTLSELDRKIDYWLHYIENEPIPVTYSYKIIKEIKRLRIERRKCKNEIELNKIFKDNNQKLCNAKNREFLLSQVQKTNKKQQNAKYGYDAYTQEEFNNVLDLKGE